MSKWEREGSKKGGNINILLCTAPIEDSVKDNKAVAFTIYESQIHFQALLLSPIPLAYGSFLNYVDKRG